jgi:hypothetical protein
LFQEYNFKNLTRRRKKKKKKILIERQWGRQSGKWRYVMTLKLCSVGGRCVSIGNWWKATILNIHGDDNVRQTAVQGTHEVLPPLVQCDL